jgi:hypothetical protein
LPLATTTNCSLLSDKLIASEQGIKTKGFSSLAIPFFVVIQYSSIKD